MKVRDIVRRAGRSLKQAKVRTLLTSLAIAVGAFTLTLAIAAGQGARDYADKLIGSNINPQALFIAKDPALFGGGRQSTGLQKYDPNTLNRGTGAIKQLTQKDLEALKIRQDLKDVVPTYQLSIKYFTVVGNGQRYVSSVSMYDPTVRSETAAGSLPSLGTGIKNDEIVVPETFAQTLADQKTISSPSDLVGKMITLTIQKPSVAPTAEQIQQIVATEGAAGLTKLAQGETKNVAFTVRALSKQSSTAFQATSGLQISSDQAQTLTDYATKGTDSYQKYTAVSALANNATPEAVKASLEKVGYVAKTAKDLQQLLFTIVNILQGIVAGFGILALFASVFGIINTQYISVLERTQQIGLMKALGMRGRDVARLFRYEAAWIGFLGGVIGAGLAYVIGTALNPWISTTISLGEGNKLLVFSWLPIVLLIIVLMLIAVVAGYFPARKAAKLDPIEALRTE